MSFVRKIILTRPEGENEALAGRLASTGIDIVVRPLIALSEAELTDSLKHQAMNLDHYDFIVFVSKSAVRFGLPLLDQYWPAWPAGLRWLAIGEGTAAALQTWHIKAQFPEQAGSEGMLAHPLMQDIEGQKGLIVRGRGGRELLATTLTERGAGVEYFEAYVRELVTWQDWGKLGSDCIGVITSSEMLDNFSGQTGSASRQVRLIVPSARIAERARVLEFANVTIAAGASEQALYDAILNECRILDV